MFKRKNRPRIGRRLHSLGMYTVQKLYTEMWPCECCVQAPHPNVMVVAGEVWVEYHISILDTKSDPYTPTKKKCFHTNKADSHMPCYIETLSPLVDIQLIAEYWRIRSQRGARRLKNNGLVRRFINLNAAFVHQVALILPIK